MSKSSSLKNKIAVFIALLFHACGAVGILFTAYKHWFINYTSLNLLLMTTLLLLTHIKPNSRFILFALVTFVAGLGAEIIGVNTAKLFGEYHYNNILGFKVFNVPLLIGINWFIIIYCSGTVIQFIQDWTISKFEKDPVQLSPAIQTISFVIDGALLATFFDWVMEPVAVKLGFWQWETASIPAYNYFCWFLLSALLLLVFRVLRFNKHNHFAIHLLIIQLLFFLLLRTVL